MTRKPAELKLEAKTVIKQDPIRTILTTGFFIILTYLLSALYTELSGAGEVIQQMYGGARDGALPALSDIVLPQVKTTAAILALIVQLASQVLSAGYQIYCLRRSRGENIGIRELLPPFKSAIKILLAMFLGGLIAVLGFICLIVPGFILLYRYRMAFYIIHDDPEVGVVESLRKSGAMMKGHKWELFVLDLSFLLWEIASAIVSALLVPALDLWVMPYSGIAKALFYRDLAENRQPESVPWEG